MCLPHVSLSFLVFYLSIADTLRDYLVLNPHLSCHSVFYVKNRLPRVEVWQYKATWTARFHACPSLLILSYELFSVCYPFLRDCSFPLLCWLPFIHCPYPGSSFFLQDLSFPLHADSRFLSFPTLFLLFPRICSPTSIFWLTTPPFLSIFFFEASTQRPFLAPIKLWPSVLFPHPLRFLPSPKLEWFKERRKNLFLIVLLTVSRSIPVSYQLGTPFLPITS